MLYVLRLQDGCYYVGRTQLEDLSRLNVHFSGEGCDWTRVHPPITIEKLYHMSSEEDEDELTLLLMETHGVDRVRGGQWSCVDLVPRDVLERRRSRFKRPTLQGCFKCGELDHWSRECTNAASTRCHSCKQVGHNSLQCPTTPVKCFLCNQTGHFSKACPQRSKLRCFRCNEYGHTSNTCTRQVACFRCKKVGHMSKECPNDIVCYICQQPGHGSKQCKKKRKRSVS